MAEHTRLNQTAATIGASLGHLQAKYDAWMKQKAALAEELHDYVTKAKEMLASLGHNADTVAEETKEAVTAVDVARKRTISAAHKRAISDAAKARWAAKNGASAKPVRNVAAEVAGRMSRMAK